MYDKELSLRDDMVGVVKNKISQRKVENPLQLVKAR